jgi:hypothetical protein
MAMKNTPFKMKGFSGFGNSPLKTHEEGHSPDLSSGGLMRSRGGGPRSNNKKKRRNKGNFWYKVRTKIFGKGKAKQKQNLKFWCSGDDC